VALAEHRPNATIFTRFVTPDRADLAEGAWQSSIVAGQKERAPKSAPR